MRRYFPSLLLAALALLAVLARPAPARAAANSTESTMAREIANDINNERAARHLPAIPFDAGDYSTGAQRVAESNRDTPCHACHSTYHPSGEVVWWGSDYPSSGSVIWWMGSPPHRALLLAPNATKLGVGVACNGTEHDAVAWIETDSEAQAPPPQPVATQPGGTKCNGTKSGSTTNTTSKSRPASTPTSAAPTSTVVTGKPKAKPTGTTLARVRSNAATPKRTNTSLKPPSISGANPGLRQAAGAVNGARRGDLSPFLAIDTSPRRAIALSSEVPRPRTGNGVGRTATAALLAAFAGALVIGRLTHRRRSTG